MPEPQASDRCVYEPDAVSGQTSIGCHEFETLRLGLRHQHPVDRVAVQRRERACLLPVEQLDRKGTEALFADDRIKPARGRELAQRCLDRDFPRAGGAHEDLVAFIGDDGARLRTQLGVVAEPPQQRMGIEQHLSQA